MSKMNVILNQNVENLGKKNDVVSVSEGYARNFLFKNNLAKEFNKTNEKNLAKELANEKAKLDKIKEKAQEKAALIEGKKIKIFVKSGADGKIFGSVSHKDVAEAIEKQLKVEVDKRKIDMPEEHIKHLGEELVRIKLHPEVVASIVVAVEEK